MASTGRPPRSGLFADYMSLASLCCNAATLRQALHFFLAYRPLIGERRIRLQEEEDRPGSATIRSPITRTSSP
jgi:hypothetical protein